MSTLSFLIFKDLEEDIHQLKFGNSLLDFDPHQTIQIISHCFRKHLVNIINSMAFFLFFLNLLWSHHYSKNKLRSIVINN